MKQVPMGLQDAGMIWSEKAAMPMHVGGFMVCALPKRADKHYIRNLIAYLRRHQISAPPWNYRLAQDTALAAHVIPSWEMIDDADTSEHVLHHALPAPGGDAELAALISRLHSQRLDLTRPLWEYHVIEGLAVDRFVIYQKVHHALVDGISGMQAFVQGTSEDPAARTRPAWWSQSKRARSDAQPASTRRRAGDLLKALPEIGASIPEFYDAVVQVISAAMGDGSGLVAPYTGPDSLLNSRITSRRRVAMHSLDLERIKTVAGKGAVTVNDIVLCVCGAALRRYLQGRKALPKEPLTAVVPVGLRRVDSKELGNKLGLMCVSLGSNLGRPLPRLRAVSRSSQAGKAHLQGMSERVATAYALVAMLPAYLHALNPKLGRPIGNLVISNMRGPERRRYLNGAPLEAVYPVSTIISGLALNITCVSYCGRVYFGLVGCPDVLPDVNRVALGMPAALKELERAFKRR
jgi:diacylglycerol O-acyltransferase